MCWFIRTALTYVKHMAAPHSRHAIFIANSSQGVHSLAANGQESNNTENVE
jgi:hypothetical protein